MRYPDEAYSELQKEIAALHKIAPERVVVGFGSTEILRAADMAFLAGIKTLSRRRLLLRRCWIMRE